MTSWRYRFLDRCGLCVTERQAIEESIDAIVTAARNHERDLKLTRTRDAERARREQAESALAAMRHERDEARAALATEQDQRSDVTRERNEAIEEARNATAVNRILKAEVPRLEAEAARLTAELAAARAVTVDVCRYLDCSESDLLAVVTSLYETRARAISDATAARGTVGGLLAAGEERESRAWSEKGKAPPGSCPFCASRISMVQRDGYFIARCSHRGCGAVGPRMRSVSRAADLFCQPPRREAQGMSCGPIVASPPRPRCSCTHEAGDSRCNVHPTCSECGASTTRPVDGCEACRGPLPKGG